MDPTAWGRHETVRYHEEFYAKHDLFVEGSWLHRPSPFVLRSLDHAASAGRLIAVDLGCGVGRHTIPVAQRLPAGSYVIGLDLLPVAAERLKQNVAEAGLDAAVQAVVADLDHVALAPQSLDVLVSVSALEHAAGLVALEGLLVHLQEATRPEGLHCLIIGTDKVELDAAGRSRPARVEFALAQTAAEALLARVYRDWEELATSVGVLRVDEERDGEHYTLETTNLRRLFRRPRHT